MSGNVHRLPMMTDDPPPAVDPLATAGIRSMRDLDKMLREAGVMGVLHGCEYVWPHDRPLLPDEARALLARNAADPLADGPNSADVVAAAGRQLQLQAHSFRVCALALRSNNADVLAGLGESPGTFFDNAKKLLTIDTELEALTLTPAGRHALAVSRETLAGLLDQAGAACAAIAKEVDGHRFEHHALAAMLVIATHGPESTDQEGTAHV